MSLGAKRAEDTLLNRLRQGMQWLYKMERLSRQQGYSDEALEQRILRGIERWDDLERMVGGLYEYEVCVMGPGRRCPVDAPVGCIYCADRSVPHWIRDG